MKRTRATKTRIEGPADAILVADLHLRDSIPVARTDDFLSAQQKKLDFLRKLSKENNECVVLCAGDVFHTWKSSPWLLAFAYAHLPTPMVTIPGNHDLPEHSMKQYERSALHLLEMVMDRFVVLKEVPAIHYIGDRRVVLLHELVWPESYSGMMGVAGGTLARELLERHEDADLVLTGDNHLAFVEELDGRLLVNPGSMMRSTADQIDHRPRCYLYYSKYNKVEPVYFPIEAGVIDRTHLDRQKERDERIAAYIERVRTGWEVGLSFRANLQRYFKENDTPQKVVDLIWQHLEKTSA